MLQVEADEALVHVATPVPHSVHEELVVPPFLLYRPDGQANGPFVTVKDEMVTVPQTPQLDGFKHAINTQHDVPHEEVEAEMVVVVTGLVWEPRDTRKLGGG